MRSLIVIFSMLFFAYLTLALVSCKSSEDQLYKAVQIIEEQVKPEPAKLPTLSWGDSKASWTKVLIEEIEKSAMVDVLPTDYKEYCPAFKNLTKSDKVQVYAELMVLMAKKESSWNPAAKYLESFKDRHGKRILSSGLFQISLGSANGYKGVCAFKEQDELFDPIKNLKCSVRILDRWVVRDKVFGSKVSGSWRGGARYWSVMRQGSSSNKYIKSRLSGSKLCRI